MIHEYQIRIFFFKNYQQTATKLCSKLFDGTGSTKLNLDRKKMSSVFERKPGKLPIDKFRRTYTRLSFFWYSEKLSRRILYLYLNMSTNKIPKPSDFVSEINSLLQNKKNDFQNEWHSLNWCGSNLVKHNLCGWKTDVSKRTLRKQNLFSHQSR